MLRFIFLALRYRLNIIRKNFSEHRNTGKVTYCRTPIRFIGLRVYGLDGLAPSAFIREASGVCCRVPRFLVPVSRSVIARPVPGSLYENSDRSEGSRAGNFLLVFFSGFYVARRTRSAKDLFLAGCCLPRTSHIYCRSRKHQSQTTRTPTTNFVYYTA